MAGISGRSFSGSVAGWLAVACLLAACASSGTRSTGAAQPPPEDAHQYYPLEAGWRWAYDIERGAERILAVYSVRGRTGDEVVIEAGGEEIRYRIHPQGIARPEPESEFDKRESVPDFLIRSPVRPGERWQIAGGFAHVTRVGQRVTVPAGTFDNCLTVEEARESPPRLVRTTYAPGVGPVMIESLAQVPGGRTWGPTLRAFLRGVTRPGEDHFYR